LVEDLDRVFESKSKFVQHDSSTQTEFKKIYTGLLNTAHFYILKIIALSHFIIFEKYAGHKIRF
jgi:hypothetical protein